MNHEEAHFTEGSVTQESYFCHTRVTLMSQLITTAVTRLSMTTFKQTATCMTHFELRLKRVYRAGVTFALLDS